MPQSVGSGRRMSGSGLDKSGSDKEEIIIRLLIVIIEVKIYDLTHFLLLNQQQQQKLRKYTNRTISLRLL